MSNNLDVLRHASSANDSLTQARGWFLGCPLYTKFLIFFCGVLGILNLIPFLEISTFFTNIPSKTITGLQIWRLFTSPFVFLKTLSLLFGLCAYLPFSAKYEKEQGTVKTIIDFFWKNLLISTIYILFAYFLSPVTDWFIDHPSYGLYLIFFAHLTEKCLEDPEGSTSIFCLPITLKNKIYPAALFVLFSFLAMSILIDIFAAVLVGFLHFKFLKRFYTIIDNKLVTLEDSIVFRWLKTKPGYVTHTTALGTTPQGGASANTAQPAGKGIAVGGSEKKASSNSPKKNYQQLDEDSGRDLEYGDEQK